MKQVTYEFTIRDILFNLVVNISNIEDGNYEIMVLTESITAVFPQVFPQMTEGELPSHLVRITGVRLVKVNSPTALSVGVRNGVIIQSPIQGELFDGQNTIPESG